MVERYLVNCGKGGRAEEWEQPADIQLFLHRSLDDQLICAQLLLRHNAQTLRIGLWAEKGKGFGATADRS